MPQPIKLSAAQARERMEMLAPEAADIISKSLEQLTKMASGRFLCAECSEEFDGESKFPDVLAAIRELNATCRDILDRGGAPVLKRTESVATVKHMHDLPEAELRKMLHARLAALPADDRKLIESQYPDAAKDK
jgi:hypothetical protein